jgi:hypothetical protein
MSRAQRSSASTAPRYILPVLDGLQYVGGRYPTARASSRARRRCVVLRTFSRIYGPPGTASATALCSRPMSPPRLKVKNAST